MQPRTLADTFATLAASIKQSFPKMGDYPAGNDEKSKNERSTVSDIQVRFAEIYAVITREAASGKWNDSFAVCYKRDKEILLSIINRVQVLALTIRVKIKLCEHENLLAASRAQLNRAGAECYLMLMPELHGKKDVSDLELMYSKGMELGRKYQYHDYVTGMDKTFSISANPTPYKVNTYCVYTKTMFDAYSAMVDSARQALDPVFVIPSVEERTMLRVPLNPQTKPEKTPQEQLKEGVRATLSSLMFTPTPQEQKFIAEFQDALQSDQPYNSLHYVAAKLKQKIDASLSNEFKAHMLPVFNSIAKQMKGYLAAKQNSKRPN